MTPVFNEEPEAGEIANHMLEIGDRVSLSVGFGNYRAAVSG